jgi:hypothetical protein
MNSKLKHGNTLYPVHGPPNCDRFRVSKRPGTAVHIAVSPGRCEPWTAKLLPAPLGGRHSSAHATGRKPGRLVLRGPRCMCSRATTTGQEFAVSGRLARSRAGVSIQWKGWRWRPLGGVHRLHRERVRREAEVEPRLGIDYFVREGLGAHQHRQGHPERGGDHTRSGRCLRRVNHGARTASRQGRG